MENTSVVVKEITPLIAALLAELPASLGRDPVDRIIVAAARADGMPLVTRDSRLRRSALVDTVW